MTNVLFGRRRTTSEHVPAIGANKRLPSTESSSVATTASSALANLASTFGMSMAIGRKKRISEPEPQNGRAENETQEPETRVQASEARSSIGRRITTPASELLRKL